MLHFTIHCIFHTEWCVIFFPSMGTLDYRKASAYYVTVTCTANGNSVNKTLNVRLTPNTPPIFNPDVSFRKFNHYVSCTFYKV